MATGFRLNPFNAVSIIETATDTSTHICIELQISVLKCRYLYSSTDIFKIQISLFYFSDITNNLIDIFFQISISTF